MKKEVGLKIFIALGCLGIVTVFLFSKSVYAYVKNDNLNNSSKKIAYITIDDGPSKYTDEIISVLNKYNAKATFFMIDNNMKKHPEQVKNIINNGNSAGLHSVSHDIHQLYKYVDSAKKEFDENEETFYYLTGQHTKLVRLPYGSKPYMPKESYERLVEADYRVWDWTIDTQDWKVGTGKIIETVKENSNGKDNIVVLMHEREQSVKALDEVVRYLVEQGYELRPIDQNQVPQNYWVIG